LARIAGQQPEIFAAYFDERLLTLPLFRFAPKEQQPEGIYTVRRDDERPKGSGLPRAWEILAANEWCVWGSGPAGIYRIVNDRFGGKNLFGNELVDALVLDEASQMSLPEAVMAALPLKASGHLIVVGDHRQMPPIVKHDWAGEQRRTFREFRSYESLFLSLLPFVESGAIPIVRFEESFRLHAEMAEFLRREVYERDKIRYHSRRRQTLPERQLPDPYLAAVLASAHPLVVVLHDEATSQHRNRFEQTLIRPILATLATDYGFDARDGVGVVVPHRAQRAALQEAAPQLVERDDATGAVLLSAVDTVERFQGGERTVILVGATESDRGYLLASAGFLLDPRRLNVALSRAKQKMVLVAARSIFDLFSADDETFANAQIWKNLLRRTCTVPLWQGRIGEHGVEVWGSATGVPPA
jgi:superfamily I DNA and/or RNA helicase